MKATTLDKPRPSGTVTLKLDPSDRERLAALAEMKKRTPHYLMKEAILDYLRREEARQNFTQAAEASYAHYKETGLHISLDEFSAWADAVQTNPDLPMPECHG
jgi:predicted transcriptional regulator